MTTPAEPWYSLAMRPLRVYQDCKRPEGATPERAAELRAAGVSVVEIAHLWGVSRSRVYQLLDRAAKVEAKSS